MEAHRRLLTAFTPQECANYFANAGYVSTWSDHALSVEMKAT
jgi:hypothetical protein